MATARPRGPSSDPERQTQERKRRLLVVLAALGVLGAAVAIAFAVRRETCDIETRLPQDREIICAIGERGPDACPSYGIDEATCRSILEQFNEKHGPG